MSSNRTAPPSPELRRFANLFEEMTVIVLLGRCVNEARISLRVLGLELVFGDEDCLYQNEKGFLMLRSIQQRYGEKLRATDGEIGHVRDFYFDDKNGTVRYLVADTGRWLSGRLVLISPHALGRLYPQGKVLLVNSGIPLFRP